MPQIHIDEVYPLGAGPCPIIANFQNGYPTDEFGDSECVMLQNHTNGKLTAATMIGDILYAGEKDPEQLGKTLLLARNRRTGKARLIEVDTVDLKPVLKADLDSTQLQETSYLELSRKFGSKKHKKYVEQREKLKINVETVTEQMQNISQTITEDQLDLSLYNKTDEDTYVPPINRTANKVDEIYDMDLILPQELYEKIYEEIEHTEYLAGFNPFMKSIADKNLNQKQKVLAVYANSLLTLYGTLMKDITKKNFLACRYSATLNDLILKNFIGITNVKRIRTPQLKDKSLCHALVFILLINNYRFDIEELCRLLKLTPRTIATKISVTGATLVTVGNKKMAQLKLPLNKPALKRRSAKH